ncbi:MAG: AAA family ATPase [Acholeplasmataceae bacterium]
MRLLTLKLENYRRFIGKHEIEFANDIEKNVTIIRAENGAGKTGILMALLFGLFGIVKYDQFQIDNDDDVMVSRPLLSLGKSATAKVEIEFFSDNSKYKIVREVTANNLNNKIYQDNANIKIKFYKDGLDQFSNKEEIDQFMNNLIGENIRSFLFFDGVRYMDLFKKPTRESKKELKKIIEKMLNIDDLDKTTEGIKYLKATLSENTNDTKLNTDRRDLLNKKLELVGKRNSIEETINEFERQNEEHKENLEIHEERLNEYLAHEDKIKELEELNKNHDRVDSSIKMAISMIKRDSDKLFTDNILFSFGNEVREELEKLAISNNQTISLVENILQSNKCICCDEPLDEKRRTNLTNLLSTMRSEEHNDSGMLSINAEFVLRAINDSKNSDDFFLEQTRILEENIELKNSIYNEILKLKDEFPMVDLERASSDSSEAKSSYSMVKARIEFNETEIEKRQKELDEISEKINKVNEEIEDVDRQIAALNNEKEKFELYDSTIKKLLKLKEEYLIEAQHNISERANEYFMKLLSQDDRASIRSLKINKDYQIEAYNNLEQEVFADLSAGQKLLASMAFTMGLTAVAANAKPTTNFPLVMDTPMSNLDKANRERLINTMPDAVIQWILTPMDTELTLSEISVFDKTNKVGKIYSLVKSDETSKILEHQSLSAYEEVF